MVFIWIYALLSWTTCMIGMIRKNYGNDILSNDNNKSFQPNKWTLNLFIVGNDKMGRRYKFYLVFVLRNYFYAIYFYLRRNKLERINVDRKIRLKGFKRVILIVLRDEGPSKFRCNRTLLHEYLDCFVQVSRTLLWKVGSETYINPITCDMR